MTTLYHIHRWSNGAICLSGCIRCKWQENTRRWCDKKVVKEGYCDAHYSQSVFDECKTSTEVIQTAVATLGRHLSRRQYIEGGRTIEGACQHIRKRKQADGRLMCTHCGRVFSKRCKHTRAFVDDYGVIRCCCCNRVCTTTNKSVLNKAREIWKKSIPRKPPNL